MNLTFLGTAAANAFPEAFCRCANCQSARAAGGRSLRKRSSLLVNDDLLIDLGPDIHAAAQMHGCPLTGVRHCLQTHGHADHLDASHLLSRSPAYGVEGAPRLHLYASAATARRAAWQLERDTAPGTLLDAEAGDRLNLKMHVIAPLRPFEAGPYRVTPFPANHDPSVEPLLYGVERDGHSFFYGTDTAALPEATWQALRQSGLHFDLVILDHTYGQCDPQPDHMTAREMLAHVERMRAEGLLKPGGRALATHIAHDCNPAHEELAAFAAQRGYEVAYDGLEIELAP
jgi:phosphoribosyl 1,2-cyclic phosphate phosphodiesterase